MVWPGMGAEVVFELYKKRVENSVPPESRATIVGSEDSGVGISRALASRDTQPNETIYHIRVLFSGKVLKSSNPALGEMDMIPVEALLEYLDSLVGRHASLVKGKCDGSYPVDHIS